MTATAVRVIGSNAWVDQVARLLADVDVPVARSKQSIYRASRTTPRKAEP